MPSTVAVRNGPLVWQLCVAPGCKQRRGTAATVLIWLLALSSAAVSQAKIQCLTRDPFNHDDYRSILRPSMLEDPYLGVGRIDAMISPVEEVPNDPQEPSALPTGRRSSSCSGALISPRLVLTAAHCCVNPKVWLSSGDQVTPGGANLQLFVPGFRSDRDGNPVYYKAMQFSRVLESIPHSSYLHETVDGKRLVQRYHDICIMVLQEPVPMASYFAVGAPTCGTNYGWSSSGYPTANKGRLIVSVPRNQETLPEDTSTWLPADMARIVQAVRLGSPGDEGTCPPIADVCSGPDTLSAADGLPVQSRFCDFEGGQSGSPLWQEGTGASGSKHAFIGGVVSNGITQPPDCMSRITEWCAPLSPGGVGLMNVNWVVNTVAGLTKKHGSTGLSITLPTKCPESPIAADGCSLWPQCVCRMQGSTTLGVCGSTSVTRSTSTTRNLLRGSRSAQDVLPSTCLICNSSSRQCPAGWKCVDDSCVRSK